MDKKSCLFQLVMVGQPSIHFVMAGEPNVHFSRAG